MSFRRSKIPKLIPLISFIILLVLGPIVFSFLQNAGKVEAAWVDDNFSYRNAIPITSHTAAENNVYITATIDTSASGQFQADCGDLRFTTVGGDILPYYIVSGCVSASTVVHVFFKSMPAGAQTLYYYYGNPSAANGFSSADFATLASSYAVGTVASQEKGGAPIAYWKFDEGYGNTASNSVGNTSLNGTKNAGVSWRSEDECVSGKCIYLNKTDSDVDVAGVNLDATQNWTVETWVKVPSVGGSNGAIFAVNGSYTWYFNSSQSILNTYWGASVYTVAIENNKWFHATLTRNGNTFTTYINGVQKGQGSTAATTAGANIFIGSQTGGDYYMQGFLDDFKIYKYTRTAAQIKSDFKSRGTAKGSSASLGRTTRNSEAFSEGLVGYWKMDEVSGAGSTLADSSGNSNTGTAVLWGGGNTSTDSAHVAGKFGNSFSFDGGDDNVTVTDVASLQAGATMTVSTWFKLNATASDKRFVDKTNNGTGYSLAANTTTPRFITGNGSTYDNLDGTTTLATGTWYHMVGTVENGTKRIYVNGNLENTASITFNGVGTGVNFRIGARAASQAVNASIDEIRIYNRALSPREVRDLYNWAPGPITYFPMEEGSGTITTDTSGGLVGTLTSGPVWASGKYGKGIDFESTSDQYITYTAGSTYNTAKANLTIETWFRRETSVGGYLIANNGGYVSLSESGSNITGYVYPAGATTCTTSGITIINGNWHHLSLTWDGTTLKVYIDGKLGCTDTTTPGSITTMANEWRIGGRPSNVNEADGVLDDVRIYNYARNSKQIVEDMNAGHPVGGSPVGSQIAYYKFDEGYGATAFNAGNTGATLNGTLGASAAAPTWSNNGKFGKALSFDGGDYINIPDDSSVNFVNKPFTISIWAHKTGSFGGSYVRLVDKSQAGTANGYGFDISNSQLRLLGTTNLGVNYTMPTGSWTHLVATYDGASTGTFYVNGKLQGTGTYTSTNTWAGILRIGTDSGGGSLYIGLLDEIKIYNSALTSDEIALDYNRGQAMVLGTLSDTSGLTGGSVASSAASALYCVPGDASTCSAPVGEWNFEESTGNPNDSSGNGNNGTWNGTGTHWADGKLGRAGNFNGSNDYVNAGTGSTLDITNAVTMEAWVYLKSTSGARYIGGKSTDEWILYFPASSSTPRVYMEDVTATSLDAGSSINLNQWYHIAFTYDKDAGTNNRKIYINGSLSNQNTATGALGTSAEPFLIGAFDTTPSNPFNGYIDGVKIFNYARTPAQVAWDYNQGKPIAQWKMDECQGGSIFDASGNGNTGTITIGATGTQTAVGTCTTSGTAWYNGVTGKFNSSLNFDGTDDYALVTEPSNNIYDSDYVTVSAWYKSASVDPTEWQKLIGKGPDGTEAFALWISPTGDVAGPNMHISGINRGVYGTSDIADQNWHHIVGLFDGNYLKIYVDGKLENSATYAGVITSNNENVSIGREKSSTTDAYSTNGQIDDVRIYNYALTPLQIRLLFNGSSAVRFGPQTGSP